MPHKAPTSRIHYSEPRLSQKRFPRRGRIAKPSTSTTTNKATPPSSAALQQTLTQIDFAELEPSSAHTRRRDQLSDQETDDDDDDDDDDDNFEPRCKSQKHKRRRTMTKMDEAELRKRQQTLTQIDFFETGNSTDDDDDDDNDNDGDAEVIDLVSPVQKNQKDGFRPTNVYQDDPMDAVEQTSPSVVNANRDQSHHVGDSANTLTTTPTKPSHRAEIPSSQSPEGSPLSSQHTSPDRLPLQEIPFNVIAQRDANTPPKPKPTRTSPRKEVKDSFSAEDDETSDVENLDPGDSTNTKLSMNESPFFINNDSFKTPTKRIASSPASFLKSSLRKDAPSPSRGESLVSRSARCTSAIDFTQFTPVKSSPLTKTTMVQDSPSKGRGSTPSCSALHRRSASPTPSRGRFSLGTIDSQLPDGRFDEFTPMAPIQDSADIVVYSSQPEVYEDGSDDDDDDDDDDEEL